MSKLAKDIYGNPIQALAPTTNAQVAIGVTSTSVAIPTGAMVVRVAANNKAFIKFGTIGLTAAATDLVFPIGSEVFRVGDGVTHIAVIQDGAGTGVLSITSME